MSKSSFNNSNIWPYFSRLNVLDDAEGEAVFVCLGKMSKTPNEIRHEK